MEKEKNVPRLGVVLLAAGKSERFGSNKLLADYDPKHRFRVEKELNPEYVPKPDEVVDEVVDFTSAPVS